MIDQIERNYNPEDEWEAHGQAAHMLRINYFVRRMEQDPTLLN